MPTLEPRPPYETDPLFMLGQAQTALARLEDEYQAALSEHVSGGRDHYDRGTLLEAASRLKSARSAHEELLQICEARAAAKIARVPKPIIEDTEGFDLKPDPLTALTPADLMAALRQYREWAGEPSYRAMAGQAGRAVAASTLCTALGSDELPRLNVVTAIVAGCGGSEEDQQRYATAWRQVKRSQSAVASPVLRMVPPPIAETG